MSVGGSSSVSTVWAERRTRGRPRGPAVVSAHGGDHSAVYHFLTSVFQAPSAAEFRASLEDPSYEPRDRLLMKHSGQIVAHAQVVRRVMHFGAVEIPAAAVAWLGMLPEYRGQGLGTRLLGAAEGQMAQSGAALGLLRTNIPHFFRRAGWAVCGRQSFSRADVRGVLAQLLDRGLFRRARLKIRPWRRWELAALTRVYNQSVAGAYGPLQRSEAYWHWLTQRQAYDQILVALDGPDLLDFHEATTRIVGYAAIKGEQIVEMACAPRWGRAAVELLVRVCRDAIEHDRQTVLLHAPPHNPLHKLLRRAGGTGCHRGAPQGEILMAKLLHPPKALRQLCDELYRRAEQAALPRPLELGLWIDDTKLRLEITRHEARVVARRACSQCLRIRGADFTRLLLGRFPWQRALVEQRIEASCPAALESARILFPRVPLWRPPLDDLRA